MMEMTSFEQSRITTPRYIHATKKSLLPTYFTTNKESYPSLFAYVDEKCNFNKFTDEIPPPMTDGAEELTTSSYVRRLKSRFGNFSTEQWIALVVLCYVYFSTYVCEEMLSAFLSTEILKHGGNHFYVGIIYGIYPIFNCLLCPVFTYLLNRISCRTMLIGGFSAFSIISLALSQIGRVTSPEAFLMSCVILRMLQATGKASTHLASVFHVSRLWKTELTFAFGVAEFSTGAAMIIGPLLGGGLYQIGGFRYPLYASLAFSLCGFFLCFYKLEASSNESISGNFLQLLRIPNVVVTVIFMCLIYACGDLLNAELQVHMMTLKASPVTIGAMFAASASTYLLVVVIVGVCAQTRFAERLTMICGGILVAISYLLLGPSPIFSSLGWTNPSVGTVTVSMLVLGFGLGAGLVPNYNDISRSAINHGMEDNETTDRLIVGLFNSACFLGEFLGPVLGGSMMNDVGDFQIVSSNFAAIIAAVVAVTAVCYLVEGKRRKKIMDKTEPNDMTSSVVYIPSLSNPHSCDSSRDLICAITFEL